MNYSKPHAALQQYSQVGAQTGVAYAGPHRLIQMLLDGAIDKIALAKGYMLRGDVPQKGNHISWAISIINGLRMSLDKTAGGGIAQHLDDLYDYMERRLFEANLKNDPEMLGEVSALLHKVKEAWDAIPDLVSDSAPENRPSAASAVR
ncbi:MAG: flagellar export chaperone FliS [Gammaproteobacteria bacterium]|nr:flagellar export chaperone FliS [Gammaproteobacteria bacterium]